MEMRLFEENSITMHGNKNVKQLQSLLQKIIKENMESIGTLCNIKSFVPKLLFSNTTFKKWAAK